MSSAIAGLITALGGFGSSLFNNQFRKLSAEETRDYNTPAQQMQRMKKAGLNPYAFAPQIANQNTGEFPAAELQLGDNIAQGLNVMSKRDQIRITKQLTAMQLDNYAEQLRSLQLDNQFKSMTLQDRAAFLSWKNSLAALDAQHKAGALTEQQYKIERDRLLTEWQQWNAGIATETYGDPAVNFAGDNAPDISNANALFKKRNADAKLATVEADIKERAKQYIIDTFKNKSKYTEQQALYMVEHALRESIARQYEESTNLPWSQKDMFTHVLEGILTQLRETLQDSDNIGIALKNAFFRYIGLPVPGQPVRSVRNSSYLPGDVPTIPSMNEWVYPPGTFGLGVAH